jgi:hypothetical protein
MRIPHAGFAVLLLVALTSTPNAFPAASGQAASGGCVEGPPAAADYGARGPFPARTIENTGPDGQYTMILPETPGEGGFVHPVATWGNGITTTSPRYVGLLEAIASHGFVIIASNSTRVTAELMTAGLFYGADCLLCRTPWTDIQRKNAEWEQIQ